MDEEEACVSYMQRTGRLYKWPDVKDVSHQPKEDIVCIVQPPSLANERSQFSFDEEEINNIPKLFPGKHVYFK